VWFIYWSIALARTKRLLDWAAEAFSGNDPHGPKYGHSVALVRWLQGLTPPET